MCTTPKRITTLPVRHLPRHSLIFQPELGRYIIRPSLRRMGIIRLAIQGKARHHSALPAPVVQRHVPASVTASLSALLPARLSPLLQIQNHAISLSIMAAPTAASWQALMDELATEPSALGISAGGSPGLFVLLLSKEPALAIVQQCSAHCSVICSITYNYLLEKAS
jgi:hypothetical protein